MSYYPQDVNQFEISYIKNLTSKKLAGLSVFKNSPGTSIKEKMQCCGSVIFWYVSGSGDP
jgi:hypothetical protein